MLGLVNMKGLPSAQSVQIGCIGRGGCYAIRSGAGAHGQGAGVTGKRHASAEARLAALLHDFAGAASESSCHLAKFFELPLTRGEIANMLGLTIETVSRKLGELEDMGAIRREGKRGIALLDATMLQDISGR